MSRSKEILIIVVFDFIVVNCAFFSWLWMRSLMGFYVDPNFINTVYFSFFIFLYWFIIFVFYGLYQTWNARSRTDELIDLIKVISIGVFIILLITSDWTNDIKNPFPFSRLAIIVYWFLMIFFLGGERIFIRTIHRKLLEKGIGRRRTLIIGWGKKAWELFDRVVKAPALGYEVIGFITHEEKPVKGTYKKIPIRGMLNRLYKIIQSEKAQEVLIAIPRRSERLLEEVISECNGTAVGIKIVPDLYDVIIGQVKTNQIYGFPLIEILPQLMQPWERIIKRIGDILFSFFLLVSFLPIWLFIAVLIRIDSRGSIFYTQVRVGRDGKIFKIFKFRSMVEEAEKVSGPVWVSERDPRITKVGKLLRKLRLDEIPQMINILKGDMSLVGPRPERPYFVEKLKKMYPLYTRRLRIRPGITGWAQVKGGYDQSLEDVKQKLEYDLFYLENMSLRMDLKIILNTIYVMLRGKGK